MCGRVHGSVWVVFFMGACVGGYEHDLMYGVLFTD